MPARRSSFSTTSAPGSASCSLPPYLSSSARPATASSPRAMHKQRINGIIHFAASIVVPDSVREPLGYYRNNTLNTCNLIDVAIANGVKHFIFSATAAVYGNAERAPVREDDPTLPISPY